MLDTFSTEAKQFVARQAEDARTGKPFFLYLALTSPHTPVSPSAKFEGKSRLGIYGDFVMETDDCLKRVLASLDQHGLAENTLVIASSDHGPALYAGRRKEATPNQLRELEKDGHYSSGIYRGYKFSIYEGALRVPFLVRWPGVVKAGLRCDQLIAQQDLMRTFADICSVELSSDEAPDSISFLPLLKGTDVSTRQTMILQSTERYAVRDGNWKLALCPGSGCKGQFGNEPASLAAWTEARRIFGKAATRADLSAAPFVQLFDLSNDPGESQNLAAEQPERIQRMIGILQNQISRGRCTPGPSLENDGQIDYLRGVPGFVFAK